MYLKKFFALSIVWAIATLSPINAQEIEVETVKDDKAKEEKKEKKGRIVVTGTRTEKLYKTAPVKTEVIDK
jgi:hypothetical protein